MFRRKGRGKLGKRVFADGSLCNAYHFVEAKRIRKGGGVLKIYQHSLGICLFSLFLISLVLHFYGSFKDENEQLAMQGLPDESLAKYLADTRFWFEPFQNWQSEFLSVFATVVLSIFLRQKGSPQSKPGDAPNSEPGD